MRERAQRFETRQEMRCRTFEVFHYNDTRPDEVAVHTHDFYEVFFLLGGELSYWVEGQQYHLEPGDILLINPMVLHRPMSLAQAPKYERIVLWVDKQYLETLSGTQSSLSRCFESGNRDRSNLLHLSSSLQRADMTERLSALIREYYGGEYGAELCAQGIFVQIMVALNRLAERSASQPQSQRDPSTLVSHLLDYINEHYQETLSLEGLAQRFFVSKYHLSHAFSRAVGVSVYRYIMMKRMTAAKQLLEGGAAPGEVYLQCGFQDYTGFFRAFKAEYGISPRAFAERK